MLLLSIASMLLALAGATASPNLISPTSPEASSSTLATRVGPGGSCGPGVGYCAPGLCCSISVSTLVSPSRKAPSGHGDTDSGVQGFCGSSGAHCTSPGCQLAFGPACDGNHHPGGPETEWTPRPHFGHVPYGTNIRSCTSPNMLALTFDDGPYTYTSDLLDLLQRNGVTATFFVTGVNGAKGPINDHSTGHPDTIRRMIADGHQIAGHSWSHEDMNSITDEEKKYQIIKLERALADIIGFFPTYYRPPYTSCGVECYAQLSAYGYHVVSCWSPSSTPYSGPLGACSRLTGDPGEL
jgi:hypothetical protein